MVKTILKDYITLFFCSSIFILSYELDTIKKIVRI